MNHGRNTSPPTTVLKLYAWPFLASTVSELSGQFRTNRNVLLADGGHGETGSL